MGPGGGMGLESLCQFVSFAALMLCTAPSFNLAMLPTLSFIAFITSAFQDVKNSFKRKNFVGVSLLLQQMGKSIWKQKFSLEEKKIQNKNLKFLQ